MIGLFKFPNDSGPIYLETVEGRFPVEPFNTYSNLIFLAILFYWGIRVYKNPKRHLFLAWVFPIIFISYLGGTIYHASRSAEIWLLLDWVPIMLLCAALVVFFIFKISSDWKQRTVLLGIIFGLSIALRLFPMPQGWHISLGYTITGLTIMIPVVWYLKLTKWRNLAFVSAAFLCFGLALFFRSIDSVQEFFMMGTHWLWHLFGGIAVHFLIAFIFRDNLLNLPTYKAVGND